MEAGWILAQILLLLLLVSFLNDNIPSPDKVVKLLKASKIKNVRIFDSDQSVLEAFSGSGLELTIGVNNGLVKEMSSNEGQAVKWVKENVESYQYSNIVGIAVGNEVLGGDRELSAALFGAVKNNYAALQKAQLSHKVMVSTAHSQAVFNNSLPPSSCVFTDNVVQYMKPLLDFFASIDSPFCLNPFATCYEAFETPLLSWVFIGIIIFLNCFLKM